MEIQTQTQTKRSFYTIDTSGKVLFSNVAVVLVLSEAGFCRLRISERQVELVRIINNRIYHCSHDSLIQYLRDYLMETSPKVEVLELLIEKVNILVQKSRLNFLKEVNLESDMDDPDSSRFFFQNKIMKVTKEEIFEEEYSALDKPIWNNRILSREINLKENGKGQFELFCLKISGGCEKNFRSLQSCLGYLLHRYKNPALTKAIIFYDSKMKDSALAEGGTGKTLLAKAIGKCRQVIEFNGKKLKNSSNFQFQKIDTTTDLMFYDDVQPNFDFDSLFALITTGIEIERKGRDAFDIPYERSPKVLITSNSYIKGPGGSSDRRRRYEFMLANVYSDRFSPSDDFGNIFFEGWDDQEWNYFFHFMMDCVKVFLGHGLITDSSKEIEENRLNKLTDPFFVEAVETICDAGEWINQREFIAILEEGLPNLSSHMFTKWIKIYCSEKNLYYKQKNSGGVLSFQIGEKI